MGKEKHADEDGLNPEPRVPSEEERLKDQFDEWLNDWWDDNHPESDK